MKTDYKNTGRENEKKSGKGGFAKAIGWIAVPFALAGGLFLGQPSHTSFEKSIMNKGGAILSFIENAKDERKKTSTPNLIEYYHNQFDRQIFPKVKEISAEVLARENITRKEAANLIDYIDGLKDDIRILQAQGLIDAREALGMLSNAATKLLRILEKHVSD